MVVKKGNFEDLLVWQKSVQLSKKIYLITKDFPKEEIYGISSQIRRSSVSIASNIAEGAERKSNNNFIRFLLIAKGSYAELKTQIIISKEVSFIDEKIFTETISAINEVSIFLRKLIDSLNPKPNNL